MRSHAKFAYVGQPRTTPNLGHLGELGNVESATPGLRHAEGYFESVPPQLTPLVATSPVIIFFFVGWRGGGSGARGGAFMYSGTGSSKI